MYSNYTSPRSHSCRYEIYFIYQWIIHRDCPCPACCDFVSITFSKFCIDECSGATRLIEHCDMEKSLLSCFSRVLELLNRWRNITLCEAMYFLDIEQRLNRRNVHCDIILSITCLCRSSHLLSTQSVKHYHGIEMSCRDDSRSTLIRRIGWKDLIQVKRSQWVISNRRLGFHRDRVSEWSWSRYSGSSTYVSENDSVF